jgi:RND family efflux transporter MFP subunit
MTGRRRLVLVAAGAAVVVAAAVAAILAGRPDRVATVIAAPQTTERLLAVVGRVRPIDLVDVRPVYAGQVVRLYRDEGDRVTAGEPLALVRSDIERAQVDADQARLAAARARTTEARRDFARIRTLFERGFAARASLDQAEAALRTAEAEAEAAQASVRATAARAREFVVRAPMDSLILVRPIDNGQVVTTATTLFQLGTPGGAAEIWAEVDEAYGGAVRPGMAARISATGSPAVVAGTVYEVAPRVDSSTGGRLVRLRFDGGGDLVPGRSADVTIVVRPAERTILVPRASVVAATVAPKVYVVGADGVVVARPVRVADWPSSHAIVEAGLAGGEQVVLEPAATKPGRRVRPQPAGG